MAFRRRHGRKFRHHTKRGKFGKRRILRSYGVSRGGIRL